MWRTGIISSKNAHVREWRPRVLPLSIAVKLPPVELVAFDLVYLFNSLMETPYKTMASCQLMEYP